LLLTIRDVSTLLDMTKDANLAILIIVSWVSFASAQRAPVPTTSASATPLSSPTLLPARTVRITFVPPPVEGTISLGVYDRAGKLVRVLHQEAELDEFTVEADGLDTKWDGKNEDGQDLPAGRYHARGYLVGCKVEELGTSPHGLPSNATDHVAIKLVPNPLSKGVKPVLDVAVGFDDQNCFLRTSDGLPLVTVSETPNLWRAFLAKSDERSIDVFQDDGDTIDQFRVSNVNRILAFDCGEIELK
jgi:hypothetical protein